MRYSREVEREGRGSTTIFPGHAATRESQKDKHMKQANLSGRRMPGRAIWCTPRNYTKVVALIIVQNYCRCGLQASDGCGVRKSAFFMTMFFPPASVSTPLRQEPTLCNVPPPPTQKKNQVNERFKGARQHSVLNNREAYRIYG